jgi:hypothetical protein
MSSITAASHQRQKEELTTLVVLTRIHLLNHQSTQENFSLLLCIFPTLLHLSRVRHHVAILPLPL